MNVSALIFVMIFSAGLLAVFGTLYRGASRSYIRGELGIEGVRILRWALLGQITLHTLLAVTAFLM